MWKYRKSAWTFPSTMEQARILNSGIALPAALALCFGFLTIRKDDITVVDFLGYAVRFFLTSQQYFEWREP